MEILFFVAHKMNSSTLVKFIRHLMVSMKTFHHISYDIFNVEVCHKNGFESSTSKRVWFRNSNQSTVSTTFRDSLFASFSPFKVMQKIYFVVFYTRNIVEGSVRVSPTVKSNLFLTNINERERERERERKR